MSGSRQDTYNVTVRVDEVPTGTWDKMSGGMVDSDETKYKPGGLAPEVSLGGSVSVENVTVSRLYDLERDHQGLVRTLIARVGKAKVAVVKQPLDQDGLPFGSPLVYKGTLKSVSPPDPDSESSDAGLLEIEVTTAGTVA